VTDTTMLRAIANALWPSLRRNRWKTHTVTRDLSKSNPRGYQAGPRTSTVAVAPSKSAVVELHHESFITAILYAEDWPGNTSHALKLDRRDHDRTLDDAMRNDCFSEIAEYVVALGHSACRAPFHAQANRHGILGLRRNAADEYITAPVATVLERIASVTKVLPITEATLDDYLIGDDDIDLDQVQIAIGGTA
jgi:hypothetical protein